MRTAKHPTAAISNEIERSDLILLTTAWLKRNAQEAKEESSEACCKTIRQHIASWK